MGEVLTRGLSLYKTCSSHINLLNFKIYSPTFNATRQEYNIGDACLVSRRMTLKIPGPPYMMSHSAYVHRVWVWDDECTWAPSTNSDYRGLRKGKERQKITVGGESSHRTSCRTAGTVPILY